MQPTTTAQNVVRVLQDAFLVLALCLLIWGSRRLSVFFILVAVCFLVIKKYRNDLLKRFAASVGLALLFFYIVFPGVASHLWHKLSSHNFNSAVRYLANHAPRKGHLFLWNASAVHDCTTSIQHDFLLSEVLRFNRLSELTFIPGPQYVHDDCVTAAETFRIWQTKFYPASLKAYDEKTTWEKALVFSPESNLEEVKKILGEKGYPYRVVYSAEAGDAWKLFYALLLHISRFTGDMPGYLILEMSRAQ